MPNRSGATPVPDKQSTMSPVRRNDVCGNVRGKVPAARDGHTVAIVGDEMIIFGGDRHRMPFADTYILKVRKQLTGKNILS